MKRLWQIGNMLSLVFALVANFLVGAQILDVPAIGDISNKYATFLTPATYAFSIWSLVYFLLVIFVIYQARDVAKPQASNTLPQKIGPYFIIASICNGLWTLIFVKEWVALSVAVLLLLTASLYAIIWRLNIGRSDAKRWEIVCVWWPLQLYAGWVTIASVVNIASWFDSLGYSISAIAGTLVLLLIAVGLSWLLYKRNLRELLLASIWGIAAVGMRQLGNDQSLAVAVTALTVSIVLSGAVAAQGFKNRHNLLPKA